jgi:RimJ/RimL family protein N-acetyltransferase
MFKNWTSDPANVKFLSHKAHENVCETEKIVADFTRGYAENNFYKWAITLKNTGELIGACSVILTLEHIDCAEVGYVLAKKFRNQGLMTEVLRGVIRFLFIEVNCHRVQARHDTRNPASGRVMIKAGMNFEGILRESDKSNIGEWIDSAIYAIVNN